MTHETSMTPTHSGCSPVPLLDCTLIGQLREDLLAAGWFVEQVNALLSEAALGALMRDQLVPAMLELREVSAASDGWARALLTRLFMLGSCEVAADVAVALPTLGLEGLLALGLAERNDQGLIVAAFDMRPHEAELPTRASFLPGGNPDEREDCHWWVLSDLGEVITGKPLRRDHVLGIGGATMNLLSLTMRTPVESALDLGTGCGIQALYLARHSQRVVATDISARAVAITRFNSELNSANLDVRLGSLFEPVDGEQFDLIVSNPPFVITPQSLREGGLMEYRDGGMERDTLIGMIIRQAPDYLSDGGVMQMLGNWEVIAGVDEELGWSSRVDHWLADLPVDAWVLQRDLLDPTQYVEMWLRDSGGTLQDRPVVDQAYEAWIGDFAHAGVAFIGMGSLAMRRLSSNEAPAAGKRVYVSHSSGNAPTGADVQLALDHLQLGEEIWGEALIRRVDVTEQRHYTPGLPDPQAIVVHQSGGMGQSFRVGSNTSAFIGACDGELTAEQIVNAIAVLTDQDVQFVRDEVSSVLPELVRAGMLTRR